MLYPPLHIILSSSIKPLNVLSSFDFVSHMTTELLYFIAALIPLIIVPIVLPMVVLLARRKRLTDSPNARKKQDSPVAVMGGTVMILAISVTSIIINLFYNISDLYPASCVMIILYCFGLLDDNIGLSWKFKMVLQIMAILLLFYGGSYGVNSLFGLFGLDGLTWWLSLILTLFTGLLLLNAVNFTDGIDGLASGLGLLAAIVTGYWNMRHGFVTQALISYMICGFLASFFVFNVFSKRYKMYMGDSGSLVLGLFVYTSACPDSCYFLDNTLLVDDYFVSFMLALYSAMILDTIRVVVVRVMNGRSPFQPDRTHLHHIYVDSGMCHLLATIKIILNDIAVLAVWLISADMGLNTELQYFIVLFAGILFIWGPYFLLSYCKKNNRRFYTIIVKRCLRRSRVLNKFSNWVTNFIDDRRLPSISHTIK